MDKKQAVYVTLGAVGFATALAVLLFSIRRAGVAEGKAVEKAAVLGAIKGTQDEGDIPLASARDPGSADRTEKLSLIKGLAAPIGA